ncbi:MAG: class I SAM-dependent methyltransferase [Deltaproteobacteria bacterium]|nr:class I SAM-dependent methyltransferase [Deltaproteobacteria bacterium]
MDKLIRQWYDCQAETWCKNYSYFDKHFVRRLANVHLLVDDLSNTSKILDIGCGSGEVAFALSERFNCYTVGVDISNGMISRCISGNVQKNSYFAIADTISLPFYEEAFDLVFSLSVIEWIEEYQTVISEVARVLKSGGQWILSLPNWNSPFRKIEYAVGRFSHRSYLKYQKNRLKIREFKLIAEKHSLKETKSIFHVMPFLSSNLPGRILVRYLA